MTKEQVENTRFSKFTKFRHISGHEFMAHSIDFADGIVNEEVGPNMLRGFLFSELEIIEE